MGNTLATSSITLEIFTETTAIVITCSLVVGIVVGILAYIISNK
jgi:hypothetical protein